MRKIVLALALVPLIALAGCQSFFGGLGTVGSALSGNVANPITPQRAFQLHAGFAGGVVVAAASYASLPRCTATIPQPCSSQPVVNQMRLYINTADNALKKLDVWAQRSANLDGTALYNAALIAVTTAQDYARNNGVK